MVGWEVWHCAAQTEPMNPKTATDPAELLRALNLANRAAVTVSEFSKLFGRARGWAYRRIANGDLRAIETSGNLMIPVSEILRFLALK